MNGMSRQVTGVVAVWALALGACGGGDAPRADQQQQQQGANGGGGGNAVTLTGAGATFPYPIYSKWFSDYGAKTGVRVNYQSIGSGGGIQQVTAGTVDFGASDAPMKPAEEAKSPGIMQLPTVLGAVVVTYNVPGVSQPLKLSGPLLADIFLGKVKRWNDPRIGAENPGVNLPAQEIAVVRRSDGSGTTYVFTEYLSAVSPAWKAAVGSDKAVKWPTGLGAKGNEGVAGAVRQTPGAIGYVELAYATQNNLPVAALKNANGAYVTPTVPAISAAAEGIGSKVANGDFRVSVVNAPGAAAYPIASWTYLLVPPKWRDCSKANAFVGLVTWALRDGSAAASQLNYAPLPAPVRDQVLAQLGRVTCGPNNQPVTPPAQ